MGVDNRDAEINRLASELENHPPDEFSALQFRTEISENVILDLSKQVKPSVLLLKHCTGPLDPKLKAPSSWYLKLDAVTAR